MRRAAAALASVGLVACGSTPAAEMSLKRDESDASRGLATTAPDETTTTSEPTTTVTSSPPQRPTTTIQIPESSIARGSLPVNLNDVWWRLALCESGGSNANTGNGYYGYHQWALPTWWGIGETGYPTDYSYEYQRAAAQRLQAVYGWSPWPACSAALGLS